MVDYEPIQLQFDRGEGKGGPSHTVASRTNDGRNVSSQIAVVSTNGRILLAQAGNGSAAATLTRLVLAFDGAGGEATGDNRAFRTLAKSYGADPYDEGFFSGHSNGNPAITMALQFHKANPNAPIFVMGYSAGGDEAIYVANQLGSRGIKIAGLVTFDPHIDWFFGIKTYSLDKNVVRALNFRQVNDVELGPNTFRGGFVKGAQNVVLSDSNHINIVTDAIRSYRGLIDAVMSVGTAKEQL